MSWVSVRGWEDFYEVSDQGEVRSVDRTVVCSDGRVRRLAGRKLAQSANRRDGRPQVALSCAGGLVTRTVHRLVLEAFVGPCPPLTEACHRDGDRTNNKLTNLRWDTKKANAADTISHGRNYQANKTHCPRGHELADWNLRSRTPAHPARRCLACDRARGRIRTSPHLSFAELADRFYREARP